MIQEILTVSKSLPLVKSKYFLLFGQSNLHKRSNDLFSDFSDLTWGLGWIILTDVSLWVVSDGYNSGLSLLRSVLSMLICLISCQNRISTHGHVVKH